MEKKINSSFSGRIELDGSECTIRFDTPYRCFEVLNEGDSDVVVSLRSGAADGDIGSVTIPAGRRVQYAHGRLDADTVYITGSGVVQIAGKAHMGQIFCPDSASAGGGDGGYTSKEFSYTLPPIAYFPYVEIDALFTENGARTLELFYNDTKISDMTSTVEASSSETKTFTFPFEATESKVCAFKVVSSSGKAFEISRVCVGYAGNSSGYNMIATEANEVIVNIGRVFTKTNNGAAICGYFVTSDSYTGPLLMSADAAAVTFTAAGNTFKTENRTITYKGYTFYICAHQYWMSGNYTDSSGQNRYKSPERDPNTAALDIVQKAYTAVTLDI